MQPTRVLQPGRCTAVLSGRADANNLDKYLQNSTITGRPNTDRNILSAILDQQLVKARIFLRQLTKYLQIGNEWVDVRRLVRNFVLHPGWYKLVNRDNLMQE